MLGLKSLSSFYLHKHKYRPHRGIGTVNKITKTAKQWQHVIHNICTYLTHMNYNKNVTSIGESIVNKYTYITYWYENTYTDGPPHRSMSKANTLETPSHAPSHRHMSEIQVLIKSIIPPTKVTNDKINKKIDNSTHILTYPVIPNQSYITPTLQLVLSNNCYILSPMFRHFFTSIAEKQAAPYHQVVTPTASPRLTNFEKNSNAWHICSKIRTWELHHDDISMA